MTAGMTNGQRAEVLVEALPYIQQYNQKIVVVKYGGNAMINAELKHAVMRDMVLLSLIGVKVVWYTAVGLKFLKCLSASVRNPCLWMAYG